MAEQVSLKFEVEKKYPSTNTLLRPEEFEFCQATMIEVGRLLPPGLIPFLECKVWMEPLYIGVNLQLWYEGKVFVCDSAIVRMDQMSNSHIAPELAKIIKDGIQNKLEMAEHLMTAIKSEEE